MCYLLCFISSTPAHRPRLVPNREYPQHCIRRYLAKKFHYCWCFFFPIIQQQFVYCELAVPNHSMSNALRGNITCAVLCDGYLQNVNFMCNKLWPIAKPRLVYLNGKLLMWPYPGQTDLKFSDYRSTIRLQLGLRELWQIFGWGCPGSEYAQVHTRVNTREKNTKFTVCLCHLFHMNWLWCRKQVKWGELGKKESLDIVTIQS